MSCMLCKDAGFLFCFDFLNVFPSDKQKSWFSLDLIDLLYILKTGFDRFLLNFYLVFWVKTCMFEIIKTVLFHSVCFFGLAQWFSFLLHLYSQNFWLHNQWNNKMTNAEALASQSRKKPCLNWSFKGRKWGLWRSSSTTQETQGFSHYINTQP